MLKPMEAGPIDDLQRRKKPPVHGDEFHGRSLLLDSQPFSRQVSINRSDQFTDPISRMMPLK
ncbi:hypothetical protein MES4922_30283 [Mesorhizobium ventifaucium]|uniref:Uncharacterized protein n=1 Tax=Mesorhizobium ventifaucium TaxID=666020 RepID=A0ABM9DYF3_9HYPH|nr:hypothetical protein MES4922_30283 [Mesorhizobium ventifaucium]